MEAEPALEDLDARIARARAAGERAAALRPKLELAARARGAATSRLEDVAEWRRSWFGLRALLGPWWPGPSARDARRALDEARAAEESLRREIATAELEASRVPELESRLLDRLLRALPAGATPRNAQALAQAHAELDRLRAREADFAQLERELREVVDALESALPARAMGEGSPLRSASAAVALEPRAAAAALDKAHAALERARARATASEAGAPAAAAEESARAGTDGFIALAHATRSAFHRCGELRQLAIADADRAARTRDALQATLLAALRARAGGSA